VLPWIEVIVKSLQPPLQNVDASTSGPIVPEA
jgi:hypothetical protein